MATIHRKFPVSASPEKAWAALRDVGGIGKLVPFLEGVEVEGDRRTCGLGEMGTLDELIISVDDDRRRIAYSIVDSPFGFEHHSASMQVVENGESGSSFIWITDVKPDAVVPDLSEAIDATVASLKESLR